MLVWRWSLNRLIDWVAKSWSWQSQLLVFGWLKKKKVQTVFANCQRITANLN